MYMKSCSKEWPQVTCRFTILPLNIPIGCLGNDSYDKLFRKKSKTVFITWEKMGVLHL